MNQFARQKQRHRCREQTYGHQGGKAGDGGRGGDGMSWEIGIDIYTPICIRQITNKNWLYEKNKIKIVDRVRKNNNKPFLKNTSHEQSENKVKKQFQL